MPIQIKNGSASLNVQLGRKTEDGIFHICKLKQHKIAECFVWAEVTSPIQAGLQALGPPHLHIGIPPIPPISHYCNICENSYNKLKLLAHHMQGKQPSCCELCLLNTQVQDDMQSNRKSYLQIHTARTCNPVIETQNNDARHKRSHKERWRLHPSAAVS